MVSFGAGYGIEFVPAWLKLIAGARRERRALAGILDLMSARGAVGKDSVAASARRTAGSSDPRPRRTARRLLSAELCGFSARVAAISLISPC